MRSFALKTLVVGLLLSVSPATGRAADEDMDEILGGFESDEDVSVAEPEMRKVAEESERRFDLSGQLSLGASYNYLPHEAAALPEQTDYEGLSRLRTQLDLQLDVNLAKNWRARIEGFAFYDAAYRIQGRGGYTEEVLDLYEWWADFQEAYVRGTPHEKIDLWIGRQIVNWGRSDTFRVVDVINPLDNREPGLVDIENLRRAVTMLRADGFVGDWKLSGLVIPEIRFDLLPSFGSDFNPLPIPPPPKDAPNHWGSAPEYAASLEGIFSGWDLSFYAGRFWENTPRLEADPDRRVYDRMTLVGAGGNFAIGNFLVKGELAWRDRVDFFNASATSRLDMMAGFEFYGFDETVIALEVIDRHLFDYDSAMGDAPDFVDQDEIDLSLRITVDLMNARLHLLGLGVVRGERAQRGAFTRFSAAYDLRDALSFTVGILIFAKGDVPPTQTWNDNDRIFAELAWSF